MTFQTDGTFPSADQSHGGKYDTHEGKQTFPPEASVSVYPQHRVCGAAHIPGVGMDPFQPGISKVQRHGSVRSGGVRSSGPTRRRSPDPGRCPRVLPCCRNRGLGGGSSNRMKEVGKLMSLEINTRGRWNLSSVTKSGRGAPVFRTASSETRRS